MGVPGTGLGAVRRLFARARARPEEDADPRGRRRSETLCYVKAVLSDAGYDPLVTGDPEGLSRVIRAALRDRAEPETFALGELTIDYGPRRVTLADRAIPLTATEFDLLRVLWLRAGNVVTTAVLLRRVWGQRSAGNAGRVRSAVKRLRRKLGDDVDKPVYIFNEHGVGYRMPAPGEG